jgi:hypothetical protein
VFGDLQRWFIRQSAKNMRREISGQVRRTFGGGRENSDVWDTATNEIPPEVGESPECQWCPICRAARRMRDSGPGIGDQLSGAGDVVASAVQDAISALDSLLSKAGTGPVRDTAGRDAAGKDAAGRGGTGRDAGAEDGPASDIGHWASASRQSAPSGTSGTSGTETAAGTAGTEAAAKSAEASWTASSPPHSAAESDRQHGSSNQRGHDGTAPESRRDRHGLVGLPGGDSVAAGSAGSNAAHGGGPSPVGERADRPAPAQDSEPDPWGAATASAEADQDSDGDIRWDRPGHEPDDRG